MQGKLLIMGFPRQLTAGLAFAALGVGMHSAAPRLLVNRVMKRIGELSFSVYVTHFAVLAVMQWVIPVRQSNGLFVAMFAVVLTVTLIVSAATYRVIEQPGIALGRILARRV